MSIRSMDLQVLIPRASEVSKAQQIQMQENNLRQAEIATQVAQQAEKTETTVTRSPASEELLIREQPEREKKHGKEGKKEGNKENSANKDNTTDAKTAGNTEELGGRLNIVV
ncbi:MAG: hypothetical protein ACM3QZ_05010 [Solirubrobacterales bacterium]